MRPYWVVKTAPITKGYWAGVPLRLVRSDAPLPRASGSTPPSWPSAPQRADRSDHGERREVREQVDGEIEEDRLHAEVRHDDELQRVAVGGRVHLAGRPAPEQGRAGAQFVLD